MNLDQNKLKERLIDFLSKNQTSPSSVLALVRKDGMIYVSTLSEKSSFYYSLGALAGGLWQAAVSLIKSSSLKGKNDLRLHFESTSEGFIILPLIKNEDELYLCCVYEDMLNPAKLRRQVIMLQQELQEQFNQEKSSPSKIKNQQKENSRIISKRSSNVTNSSLLFENITDKEMDDLFRHMEN